MICNYDSKISNAIRIANFKFKHVTLEQVSAALCFLSGTVFLVLAFCGIWHHFFTMGLCYGVGVMVYDGENLGAAGKRKKSGR